MGRYISGDFDFKFWFACQPSSDILEFGSQRDDNIHAVIYFDELENIKTKVADYKLKFKKKYFEFSYEEFMKKMETKGYLSASDDKETNTKVWADMSREASRISLGDTIIKELELKQDDLYVEAEC